MSNSIFNGIGIVVTGATGAISETAATFVDRAGTMAREATETVAQATDATLTASGTLSLPLAPLPSSVAQ